MVLDSASAKALAIILIVSNQGHEVLDRQLPLTVVDQGDTWLVKGTPFRDKAKGLDFCLSHVIIRRNDAEVLDFGFSGRMELTPAQRSYWQTRMTPEDFDRVFGPRTTFDPTKLGSTAFMDANRVVHGGLVNSSDVAIQYALVLMRSLSPAERRPRVSLNAVETGGMWHISATEGVHREHLFSISRRSGRMTSER